MPHEFQSSPGWLAGRCILVDFSTFILIGVSILARLVGRALRCVVIAIIQTPKFQSSPGWLAGRCK